MAHASETVLVGEVIEVHEVATVTPPGEVEDDTSNPSEWVAVTVRTEDVLSGAQIDEVTLVWESFMLDEHGDRIMRFVTDGLETPKPGDHYLLFLVPESDTRIALFSGAPTHLPVSMDGIALLRGDTVADARGATRLDPPLQGAEIAEIAAQVGD